MLRTKRRSTKGSHFKNECVARPPTHKRANENNDICILYIFVLPDDQVFG